MLAQFPIWEAEIGGIDAKTGTDWSVKGGGMAMRHDKPVRIQSAAASSESMEMQVRSLRILWVRAFNSTAL